MLLGAYGRGADARVAAGVAHLSINGPAEFDVLDRGELVLAVRRHQGPEVAEQGGRLCVLDGEITAARWHTAAGGSARSPAPAELLEQWLRLGDEMVTGMRGRFVLVLWDGPRRSGLLVRDPTGLQPLVRTQSGGALVFASEIKQLLGALPQTPSPDLVALAFWLSNDSCWADRTAFQGVTPLRAGRLLALDNGRASERTWWRPRYAPPADMALPEAQEAVRDAITAAIRTLPEQLRRSLTWDQGAEMAQHAQLRIDTGLEIYFCDPQSPWQRGSNENTNGLLRQYFPKGTDLARYSADDLAAVAATLNSRPRKTLAWRTPAEALNHYLSAAA